MNIHFAGAELLTGLPEYRNGGLFIDTGCLTLKSADAEHGLEVFKEECDRAGKKILEVVPMFRYDDDAVVEWRAATVGLLDLMHEEVNKLLGLKGDDRLSLPQVLEAGSWKVCSLYFQFPFIENFITDFSPGRTRNRRSLQAQYQGTAYHHSPRRNLLIAISITIERLAFMKLSPCLLCNAF
jgi:hypothetical protein